MAIKQANGRCKKCKRPFLKPEDKCTCQRWLCYRCCECESDCDVCNCKVKKRFDIKKK